VHRNDDAIIAKALELGFISERELAGCRKTIASLSNLGIEKTLLEALTEHRFLSDEQIRMVEASLDGIVLGGADSPPAVPVPEPEPEPEPDADPSFVASIPPDGMMEFEEPPFPDLKTESPPTKPDDTSEIGAAGTPEPPAAPALPDGTMDFAPDEIAAAFGVPDLQVPDGDPDMSAPTAVAGGATLESAPKREDPSSPAADLLSTYEKNLRGQTLGGCRLETQLGKGAMGTVFKATHLALRKVVAVKLLNPSRFYQKKQVEQFFREARAAAAIEHQNIVGVHDVGQERGLYYIVMQFIEGESLQERIKKDTTIAPKEAIRITIEAARGLGIAHEKGIVHRDVKPANLMLTPSGEVKIADFGLAHQGGETSDIAGDVEIMGTPAYMSPEQIDGRNVDQRADLYSLGVTLYYMTTGRKPFDAPTPMEVLLKHMSERLIPPTQVNPRIPRNLGQVIERLMAKDPASRYSSAEELIKDLEDIGQGAKPRAVTAMEDVISRMERVAREEMPTVRSRQPITAAVVSGVVATLCAILFTVALPDIKADPIESFVEANEIEAKVSALFEASDAFARKNPEDIGQIRKGFMTIINDYDFLDAWPMKARTRIRECERKFAELGRTKTKQYFSRSAKARLDGDTAGALLELDRIPEVWRSGILGKEIAQQRVRLAAELRKRTGMALVTEGEFLSGRDKKSKMTETPFLIQVHEVSNEDYAKYVKSEGRAPKHWEGGKMPAGSGAFPVFGVTYDDAAGYAEWAGMRLPTVLEWERAARGTDGREYPWGDRYDHRLVNCFNRRLGVKPVTAYPGGASPVGCLNMAGNVHEWTSTPDETGTCRIVKGGAYRTNIWCVRTFSTIARPETDDDPDNAIGFRCVKDL